MSKLMGLGLNLEGHLLFEPVEEDKATEQLIEALELTATATRKLSRMVNKGETFRSEAERATEDPGDPRKAGWTYLIHADDPRRDDIAKILAPLAEHRGMDLDLGPLVYDSLAADDPFAWLNEAYFGLTLDGKQPPKYVLIIGDPSQVPFQFQSLLDSVANVGRVDFDSLDDLEHYVSKVIRIEQAKSPIVDREAIVFAPDAGLPDPTYFSRLYMAEPLVEHIQGDLHVPTTSLLGADATKSKLLDELRARKPALVYTASHGLGAMGQPEDVQRRYNGAICCQHDGALTPDALFAGDDVPANEPFLEGSVIYQFACFGYGTPAVSDYAHWLTNVPKKYTEADFVAALPKRLLAHPRGPLAYIGHLDTAFLHGFTDQRSPHILDRWHVRIAPFVDAVDRLLRVENAGRAMEKINQRYAISNALLTNTYDRIKRSGDRWEWTPQRRHKFVDTWIYRGDAQNYMVLGDPAAHLRIPKPGAATP